MLTYRDCLRSLFPDALEEARKLQAGDAESGALARSTKNFQRAPDSEPWEPWEPWDDVDEELRSDELFWKLDKGRYPDIRGVVTFCRPQDNLHVQAYLSAAHKLKELRDETSRKEAEERLRRDGDPATELLKTQLAYKAQLLLTKGLHTTAAKLVRGLPRVETLAELQQKEKAGRLQRPKLPAHSCGNWLCKRGTGCRDLQNAADNAPPEDPAAFSHAALLLGGFNENHPLGKALNPWAGPWGLPANFDRAKAAALLPEATRQSKRKNEKRCLLALGLSADCPVRGRLCQGGKLCLKKAREAHALGKLDNLEELLAKGKQAQDSKRGSLKLSAGEPPQRLKKKTATPKSQEQPAQEDLARDSWANVSTRWALKDSLRDQAPAELLKPKKPPNAWVLFLNKHGGPRQSQRLNSDWGSLSEAERQPYKDEALALLSTHKPLKQAWDASKGSQQTAQLAVRTTGQTIPMLLLFVAEKMMRIHVSLKVNPSETDPETLGPSDPKQGQTRQRQRGPRT